MKKTSIIISIFTMVLLVSSLSLLCVKSHYSQKCHSSTIQLIDECPFCGDPACDGSCFDRIMN